MSPFKSFTIGIAAAALLALPASGVAQTPPSQPPATQPPATSEPQQPTAQKTPDQSAAASAEAKEHLTQAKTALEGVHVDTLSARAKSQVAELKKRLNTLERSVSANDQASATGAENRNPRATTGSRGKTNWGTEVAAIDKTLTALLGPDATTGAPAATGTTGASKTKPETLDEPTRAKLLEVRTHITAFATAMAGGKTAPEPSAQPATEPSAANPPATNPPATTTPPTTTPPETTPPATTPPATAPPSSTPQPTGTTGTMPSQDPATQTAQPDEQLARRHLTEARNTLSELTQLPAASQLAGETRTQVSQLISNFNELITTQAEWRASYAKVNANLTALIGPDPGAANPSGVVGTSGTAANLDPAIREKLLTLRTQLTEFEKAAGGTAATPATSNPRPEDPPAATAPPATTPPTTTPPATTPPSTTPPATTPPATTPPATEPQTATPTTQGTQAVGNADLMRHIAAIEAILKSEDDSGGLTLTKAQLEQLRTHLTALRQGLDKK
jgi:hypothetical protein